MPDNVNILGQLTDLHYYIWCVIAFTLVCHYIAGKRIRAPSQEKLTLIGDWVSVIPVQSQTVFVGTITKGQYVT